MAITAPLCLVACAGNPGSSSQRRPSQDELWMRQVAIEFVRVPDTVPTRWRGLIGEYGRDTTNRWFVLEREGRLWVLDHRGNYIPLAERNDSTFDAPRVTAAVAGEVRFTRDTSGRASAIHANDSLLPRRAVEPPPGTVQLRITPVRPIDELRREALAATPPAESGSFRPAELVELTKLDTTVRLDVRYATENNFLGTKLYEEPRAFLQRPAAEALARANRALRFQRFVLLVHDAYRPWYVTKIFWDATPDSLRWLVANPAQGSKHNRGAAVDVSLYDLVSQRVVEMPSTYDESTGRAAAGYPGGTARERWHRALLKRVMEHEGFTVNPLEWWHFDYKDWKSYAIGNQRFEQITRQAPVAPGAGPAKPR
jgi:D-alanyl-D-alanine dipeptidase